jgi:hypothetical protein
MDLNLTIDENNINGSFKRIAKDLMNKWAIQIVSKQYRIAEIEFYYNSEFHVDPYAHGHTLQNETGRWYFHGSGLDLTIGGNGSYGGILIRAIYDFEGKNYIYGPLNCVTELFRNLPNVLLNNISFGLTKADFPDSMKEKLIAAPRVGLNPAKDKEKCEALFRFLIMPKYKHAEKTKIEASMKLQPFDDHEIKNIWG